MATQTYTNSVTLTDAAEFNRFDTCAYNVLTSVGGTANAITATGPANYTLSSTQPPLVFTPTATNTGATTINITPSGGAALTAKNIFAGNSALVGGELHSGIPVLIKYDGTQFQLIGTISRQPTRTVLTSGSSATYTTPTGATRINVRMVGPGGGGSAVTTNSGSAGTADTTFGSLTASKGSGGTVTGNGGAGGGASGGDINVTGQAGVGATGSNVSGLSVPGGAGGNSVFGGAGCNTSGGGGAGQAAATNSGSGGQGGSGGSTTNSGSGGGAGGYCEKLITSPATTYTYTVGGGGNGGSAGAAAGGNGAAGIIIVDEFYN